MAKRPFNGSPTVDGYYTTFDSSEVHRVASSDDSDGVSTDFKKVLCTFDIPETVLTGELDEMEGHYIAKVDVGTISESDVNVSDEEELVVYFQISDAPPSGPSYLIMEREGNVLVGLLKGDDYHIYLLASFYSEPYTVTVPAIQGIAYVASADLLDAFPGALLQEK